MDGHPQLKTNQIKMPGNRNRHRHQQVIRTEGQPIVAVQVNPAETWSVQPTVVVTAEIAPAVPNDPTAQKIKRLQDQINQLKKSNKTFKTELRQEKKSVSEVSGERDYARNRFDNYILLQDKVEKLIVDKDDEALNPVFNQNLNPRKVELIIDRITKDLRPCFRMTSFEWSKMRPSDKFKLLNRWHNDGTPIAGGMSQTAREAGLDHRDPKNIFYYHPACPMTEDPWDMFMMPLHLDDRDTNQIARKTWAPNLQWDGESEKKMKYGDQVEKALEDFKEKVFKNDFIPLLTQKDVYSIWEHCSLASTLIQKINHKKNPDKVQEVIERQRYLTQDIFIKAVDNEFRNMIGWIIFQGEGEAQEFCYTTTAPSGEEVTVTTTIKTE